MTYLCTPCTLQPGDLVWCLHYGSHTCRYTRTWEDDGFNKPCFLIKRLAGGSSDCINWLVLFQGRRIIVPEFYLQA